MSNIYRAGVIGRTGQGDYGHGLDLAFAGLPNVAIIAVADTDPAGLKAAAQRTGAKQLYQDYREMLKQEKLDLVSVAPRWVDGHHDMVIACAEAGVKGIFCEKPFAATLAEADEMLAACERRGVRVAVAHRRANAYEQHAKKLVDEGLIGEVQVMRGQGKGDHRSGGQDLMVLGTHILDSMRYFAGAEVAWAMGHVTQDGREVTAADAHEGSEGVGLLAGNALSAYYVFQNGINAHFESRPVPPAGSHVSSRWFGFEVYGTKGILSLRNSPGGELYLYRHGMWLPDDAEIRWERLSLDEWERHPDGQSRSGAERMQLSNRMIVTELIEAIEADRDVVAASSGYDARAALEMIMAVHESQRLRGRVDFPLKNRENPYKTWQREQQ
jgi:predicted dehydrogenase